MNLRIILPALFVTAAAIAGDTAPEKTAIPINKETTFLTAPLSADGSVNYIAAVEAILGKDVTMENNAFFPLMQVSGWDNKLIVPEHRDDIFKRFQLDPAKLAPDLWEEYQPEAAKKEEQETEIVVLDELYKVAWTKKEHARYAAWLEKIEPALAAVTQAVQRDHYFMPLWSKNGQLYECVLPSLVRFRSYGKALNVRATFRIGQGDLEGAKKDIVAAYRLGWLISQGGTVIERLVGIFVQTRAARTAVTLAFSQQLSAKNALECIKLIESQPETAPVWESVNLMERCSALDAIASLDLLIRKRRQQLAAHAADPKANPLPPFDFNIEYAGLDLAKEFTQEQILELDLSVAMRTINALFDAQVAAMKADDPDQEKSLWSAHDGIFSKAAYFDEQDEFRHPLERALWDHADQKLTSRIVGGFYPTLGRAVVIEKRSRVNTDLARVALALAAYKADEKSYPPRLGLLKGKYLAEIPIDRFSRNILIYRTKESGYILYSVGDDLNDDGGTPIKSGKGDIAIETEK